MNASSSNGSFTPRGVFGVDEPDADKPGADEPGADEIGAGCTWADIATTSKIQCEPWSGTKGGRQDRQVGYAVRQFWERSPALVDGVLAVSDFVRNCWMLVVEVSAGAA